MDRPTFEFLTGKSDIYLSHSPVIERPIHEDVLPSFLQLKKDAEKEGFQIKIVSGFRSYEQQEKIWNNKAAGKRTLLDANSEPLDYALLSDNQIVEAILNWSAIPGASRHHWGTEIDIIDANGLPSEDYEVQLVPSEVETGGIFGPFHDWLSDKMQNDKAYGFYRPYTHDHGGVKPERWHVSYRPLSDEFIKAYTLDVFKRNIEESSLLLREILEERIEDLYKTYVLNNA